MENTQDNSQSVNEEAVEETTEAVAEETPNESSDKDYRELYENQKTRAEKAESRLKEIQNSVQDKPTKEEAKPETKSDNIDFGQLAFHNSKSNSIKIEAQEDIDFLQKTIEETGKSQEAVLNSSWFQSELRERVDARTSAGAVPKGTNRPSGTGHTEIDVAVAKYRETGDLPKDFATRNKVIDIVTDKENTHLFDGPSVIGTTTPRG